MRILLILIPAILSLIYSCNNVENKDELAGLNEGLPDSNLVTLEFILDIDRDVYDYTTFGEAPQIAIWLENPDSAYIQTVWVSNRAGKNQWKGKVECPVALPYWESKHLYEKSGFEERNILERLIDTISGATPTGGIFTTSINVSRDSKWEYYVEVNASGDYNKHFPYWSKGGLPDSEGNGQPSVIYSAAIIAESGKTSRPELIGRSKQRQPVDSLLTDLSGITTAGELLTSIEVRCR